MAPKVVLISGCSSGIGLSTAVLLATDPEKRFKVNATMRNLAKKGKLEEEGKDCLGDTLVIKQMDVCSDDSVDNAVKEIICDEGRIDVLFNNAGIVIADAVLEFVPTQLAKDMFEVNYFGTLRLIKAVLPNMKSRESGQIVNNSSHYGVVGLPFCEVYTSTKFAVEGLTEALAPILRQFNISCSLVETGPSMTSSMASAAQLSEAIDQSKADKKSLDLKDRVHNRMYEVLAGGSGILPAERVAEVVKEIILSDQPDFRYQTHKDFGADEILAKLSDPTGNKPLDLMSKRFLEEK